MQQGDKEGGMQRPEEGDHLGAQTLTELNRARRPPFNSCFLSTDDP